MRLSRFLTCCACAATVTLLCACGSSSSSTTASTATSSACAYTSDSVTAESPVVKVSPPGSNVAYTVSQHATKPVSCGTTLTVGQSGTAQAQFGGQESCQLMQYNEQLASLTTRTPSFDLLTLNSGQLWCSINLPIEVPNTVTCPYGTVRAQSGQWYEICASDPVFEVAVYRGSVQVTDTKGQSTSVLAGHEVYFDFAAGVLMPSQPHFLPADRQIFRALALAAKAD